MKAFLHLRPDINLLTMGEEQSVLSDHLTVLNRHLPLKYPFSPKTYKRIPFLLFILVFVSCGAALAQEIDVHSTPAAQAERISGIVVSAETGEPLEGATVKIKNTSITTITNLKGQFTLIPENREGVIEVSFLGYLTAEISFSITTHSMVIRLEEDHGILEEVIVNTGYQEIPKERATGSFVVLDNNSLNRRISTDIISRMEDLVPGLSFNRNNSTSVIGASSSNISIRGQSTILGNAEPLIVIDNFPYDGDIENINPNDVESITVLKDAAAASIWGARAGNGVIVIKTKTGKYRQAAQVKFNANTTITSRPELGFPEMSSSDFIEVEKLLFEIGYYRNLELSTANAALTPVVDLLIAQRDGILSSDYVSDQIEGLKQFNYRDDLKEHFYRSAVNRQYSLSISGGSDNYKYLISSGYDKNLGNLVNTGYERLTFNTNNTYRLLSDKIELNANLYYAKSNTKPRYSLYGIETNTPFYPYARLADDNGEPLGIIKNRRTGFLLSAKEAGLLDWEYRPLEELNFMDNNTSANDYRINLSANFKINSFLAATTLYSYYTTSREGQNRQSVNSYYTRNLINSFTQVSETGIRSYPIPIGDIVDKNISNIYNHNFRFQLNLNKLWEAKHELNGIAGFEIKDLNTGINAYRLYGYDQDRATLRAVSYNTPYRQYWSKTGSTSSIPFMDSESGLTDRYRSFYTNLAYSNLDRYLLSGSVRLDQSNIFGVKANQKGVPLYSVGIGWNVHLEEFYNFEYLPYLKFRATYGHNGNVYKNISANTTVLSEAWYNSSVNSGMPYATVVNPPYPDLRWERIKVINLGLDFRSKNQVLSGSLEYYVKRGMDLIGTTETDPSVGVYSFTGNNANTISRGVDLLLNTNNINKNIKWRSSLLFSLHKDKVTRYGIEYPGYIYPINFGVPLNGKPLFSLYSYQSAGLDPNSGQPLGYLNGEISNDFSSITMTTNPEDLIFNGSIRPQKFGSLINYISHGNLSLSFNVSYRFDYYFRKNSINYSNVLRGLGGHADYEKRWKKPGDELTTYVPSMPEKDNLGIGFYLSSDVLALRADHIRLQDITLSYQLNKMSLYGLPVNDINLYFYLNNLGVIWTANKERIDPDYQMGTPPKNMSIGLKIGF